MQAFLRIFTGEAAAPRVLSSFLRLRAGQEHSQQFPGLGLQVCSFTVTSYTTLLSILEHPRCIGTDDCIRTIQSLLPMEESLELK
jgi:hypothetical protein